MQILLQIKRSQLEREKERETKIAGQHYVRSDQAGQLTCFLVEKMKIFSP